MKSLLISVLRALIISPICFSVTAGGFKYGFVDGELSWSYQICVPWYDDYVNLTVEPPVIERGFSLSHGVQVTPWVKFLPESNL